MMWKASRYDGGLLHVLGYFTSKRALLRFCKLLIGTDAPNTEGVWYVSVIGRSVDGKGRCAVQDAGTVTFVGEWSDDGNTHRIVSARTCWTA